MNSLNWYGETQLKGRLLLLELDPVGQVDVSSCTHSSASNFSQCNVNNNNLRWGDGRNGYLY